MKQQIPTTLIIKIHRIPDGEILDSTEASDKNEEDQEIR